MIWPQEGLSCQCSLSKTQGSNPPSGTSLFKNEPSIEKVGLWCDLNYFRQFGPGTYLFFAFSKRIAILFAVLAALSLPALVFNALGKGLESTGAGATKTSLMKFSVANQPVKTPELSEQAFRERSANYKLGVVIPDMLYSLTFFVFLLYWEYSSSRTTRQLRSEYQLPSYYTVKVKGLPENTESAKLKEFMGKFGEVVEISEVRNYEECIRLSKRVYHNQAAIVKCRSKTPLEEQLLTRLKHRRSLLFKELTEELAAMRPSLIECFVMFKFPADRKNCISRFHEGGAKCCRKQTDPSLLFGGRLPQVLPCNVQPSSIIWQNMHVSKLSRSWRMLLQALLVVLVTCLAVLLILLLSVLVPQQTTSSINTSSYNLEEIGTQSNETIRQSWCLNQDPSAVYSQPDLKALCQLYYNRYFGGIGISFAISLAVVLVSLLLILLVRWLARFQRYKSYNEEVSSSIVSLLFANVLTTSIITILLQADIFGFSFRGILLRAVPAGYLHDNADKLRLYNDLVREWYVDIGYHIVLNWLVLTFVPYIFNPLVDWLFEKLSQWRARRQTLQVLMDKLLQKPQFLFEEHYANLLTVVFVPFAFAGPMPLLLPISAIALTVRYFYSKYYFLRFCRAPRAFDESLNQMVMNLLPLALFFHLMVSIYAYGATDIFPTESSISIEVMEAANRTAAITPPFVGRIVKRLATSWLIVLVFVVVLAVYLGKLLLVNGVSGVWGRCQLKHHKLPTRALMRNKTLVIGGDHNLLNSYRIENNPDYNEVLSILRIVQTQNRLPEEGELMSLKPSYRRVSDRTSIRKRLASPQLKPAVDIPRGATPSTGPTISVPARLNYC